LIRINHPPAGGAKMAQSDQVESIMKRLLLMSLVALAGTLGSGADAASRATLDITHITRRIETVDPATSRVTSDEDVAFTISAFSGPDAIHQTDSLMWTESFSGLVRGSRIVADYSYTLTVSDDGLLGEGPITSFCLPLHLVSCAPRTGREVAFAQLLVGYIDPRSAIPFVSIVGHDVRLVSDPGNSFDGMTQSGVLEASIETLDDFGWFSSGQYGVFGFVFANGQMTPVPEPPVSAMLGGGIALLGALRSWNRRQGAAAGRGGLDFG
jgi:hypothetical protein